MEENVYRYLQANPKLQTFVRHNPIWYRYLARDGIERITDMEKEAKLFFGETFPQRLEKWNQNIQMTSMLMEMAKMMKD